MRPSGKPEVAFVLNQRRESRIIHEAFEDFNFILDHDFFDPDVPSAAPDTKVRFEKSAINPSEPIELPSSGQKIYHPLTGEILQWPDRLRYYPNFEVRYEDLYFVQKATERILTERNAAKRAWNTISGRQRTATRILLQVARVTEAQLQPADKPLDYTPE